MTDRQARKTSRRRSPGRDAPVPEEAIGARVRVRVDGVDVRVPLGTTILEAARFAGVRIPTLCHHAELGSAGLCRVCLVEVSGLEALQAACSFPITSPLDVQTHTREVMLARRRVVELLLARHDCDCTACARNADCELRRVAAECGVEAQSRLRPAETRQPVDTSLRTLIRDPNRCIGCRRCVRTCSDLQDVGVFGVMGRGETARVSTFADRPLAETGCVECGQCLIRCPTAALGADDSAAQVWAAIEDPDRQVIVALPASARIALGDERGALPGALRRLGFSAVFDPGTAADVAVLRHVAELLERLHRALVEGDVEARTPLFTSCCPGWVSWARRFLPEDALQFSRVEHPLRTLTGLAPEQWAAIRGALPASTTAVAVVPCAALERECAGDPDRGALALTTRALGRMLADAGLDLGALPAADCDPPFAAATGSGALRDVTGGLTESVLRALVETVRGVSADRLFDGAEVLSVRGLDGIKYAEIPLGRTGAVPEPFTRAFDDFGWLGGRVLKMGVCHGLANARRVVEDVRAGGRFSECHLIEVMACPGGCVGGGGQPLPAGPVVREQRTRAISADDRSSVLRKAGDNRAALEIFDASWYGDRP